MSHGVLLQLAVFAPFVGALAAPWLGRALGARAGYVLWLAFVPSLALVTLAGPALAGTPAASELSWVPSLGLAIALRGDGFSLLFALLVGGIGALVTIYAAAYLGAGERHGRFYGYLLAFGGAMLGLVLTDNLAALFAFWELTSITSFLLIGFWDSRGASRDGAVKALVVTAVGGLALLVAVLLLAQGGHSATVSGLDVAALRSSPLLPPALALLVVAAFTKSAQLPFHLWLPTAMEAPTPISAYLHSATMVKAGVFLVATFHLLLAGTAWSQVALYGGLLTMFWGSYLALRQTDLKALLAYSTVSQLGILTALYGAGDAFAATAHLVNHAAFKAALFLIVGIVDHATGSRDLRALRGLGRVLPVTAVLAVPAALSMGGVPPFGGFISKELFYEGMLHVGPFAATVAVVGSVMTLAYSLRFLLVFFGPLRVEHPDVHRPSWAFWLPVTPLVAAVLLFGLVPLGNTAASWFTDLAAPSFGYRPEALTLWHGPSVALALSVLTWFAGIALHVVRDRFGAVQRALTPRWNANTVFYALLTGLERAAAAVTRATQGASFAAHLRIIVAAIALVGVVGLPALALPDVIHAVPVTVVIAALLVLAAIGGVIAAVTRLSALIFMGLAGLASTLLFVLLRAPDLALTQLLIETVTVILFLSVFRFLPLMRRYARPLPVALFDALLSLAAGATFFLALLAVQQPIAPRIEDFFVRYSKLLAGGNNVVNVILVDFRGYDTMGEITVLAIVAVSVVALMRLRSRAAPAQDAAEPLPDAPVAATESATEEGEAV